MFLKGKIFIVTNPIFGRAGIPKLMSTFNLLEKTDDWSGYEEVRVVCFSKDYKTMKIIHVDEYGVDLTTRRLHKGKFNLGFINQMNLNSLSLSKLTEEEFLQLFLDGTYKTKFNHMQNFNYIEGLKASAQTQVATL